MPPLALTQATRICLPFSPVTFSPNNFHLFADSESDSVALRLNIPACVQGKRLTLPQCVFVVQVVCVWLEKVQVQSQGNVKVSNTVPAWLVAPCSASLILRSLRRYNGMFWNRLFHRDKSDEELSKIYRGFRSSPPVLTRPSPTPPQKARRVSARLNTISQECHDRSSQKKLPTTPSPNASVGVGGAIADMLPCLSNTPIPVKEIAVEAKEDISPIKLHSFEKERFDTQLDSPMNGVGMLTPSGERILSKDPMMILHSTESTPSATQWEKFSHLNCFTTKRELDDISDLSTEAPIRASEIFRTPSTYLCDLSVFPLGSLGLHTIQPSSSKRDWASSAAKGFQEGFTPIVQALDQAFKAADPQFNTTSTPDQEPPTKKVFSSKASDETSSSTNSILHGSCTQFSPLVPKFNHSGSSVLLPEVHSRAKQHSPAPWTGDDPTAISRFSGPSRHQNLRHPPAHLH